MFNSLFKASNITPFPLSIIGVRFYVYPLLTALVAVPQLIGPTSLLTTKFSISSTFDTPRSNTCDHHLFHGSTYRLQMAATIFNGLPRTIQYIELKVDQTDGCKQRITFGKTMRIAIEAVDTYEVRRRFVHSPPCS